MIALLAILFSAIVILFLAWGDPKRRRAARLPGEGQSAAMRRMLAMLACLPGLYCALSGDAAAFMIWLGGAGVAGWLIALALRQPGEDAA